MREHLKLLQINEMGTVKELTYINGRATENNGIKYHRMSNCGGRASGRQSRNGLGPRGRLIYKLGYLFWQIN